MKNLIKIAKKILAPALVAMVIIIAASPNRAHAQAFSPLMSGGTNNVANNATNTYGTNATVLSTLRSRIISVQASFNKVSSDVNNSNVTFAFDASVDGSVWFTNMFRLTILGNSTNTANSITNLDTGGYAFLRAGAVENLNTNAITNVTVNAGRKTGL